MRVQANFLSGENYALDLPDGVDPSPDLQGIVTYDYRPRIVAYMPYSRRPRPSQERLLAHAFDVRTALTVVSVYRTLDGSEALRAYWQFPAGSLATFMQDDHDCGGDYVEVGIRTVIEKIDVSLSRQGFPVIEIRPPLRAGDERNPLERQEIIFWRSRDVAEQTVPNISVTREPPWVAEGEAERKEGDAAVTSVTNALGVTVTAFGPYEQADRFARHAKTISASIAPVP